jgi:hypothetical protein
LAGISVFSDKNSEQAVQLVEKALQDRHFSQFALFRYQGGTGRPPPETTASMQVAIMNFDPA